MWHAASAALMNEDIRPSNRVDRRLDIHDMRFAMAGGMGPRGSSSMPGQLSCSEGP
jgi:hypothetical protein